MRGVSWEGRCLSGRQPPRKEMNGMMCYAPFCLLCVACIANNFELCFIGHAAAEGSGPPSYFPLRTLLFNYVIFCLSELA